MPHAGAQQQLQGREPHRRLHRLARQHRVQQLLQQVGQQGGLQAGLQLLQPRRQHRVAQRLPAAAAAAEEQLLQNSLPQGAQGPGASAVAEARHGVAGRHAVIRCIRL